MDVVEKVFSSKIVNSRESLKISGFFGGKCLGRTWIQGGRLVGFRAQCWFQCGSCGLMEAEVFMSVALSPGETIIFHTYNLLPLMGQINFFFYLI